MLRSSKDIAAEQLQVGQIPSKPALNPLFRLDCQNKTKTDNSSPPEDAPSIPQPLQNVTIQNIADAVITTSSVELSNSRRDHSLSRSRSRSREQKNLKIMKGKKRSSESEQERDHTKDASRSKNRSKNDVSFQRRSSARLQEKAISKLQSPIQSKLPSKSSNLNGNSASDKKEDLANNLHNEKFYKTRICPQFLSGYCDRGDKCTYAHGEQQIRQFQGACFKTKMCYSFTQGRCQKKSEQCRYAHGVHDLRASKDLERVQMQVQEQEKKSYSPQTHFKVSKRGKGQKATNRDNYQESKRYRGGNKGADNRKMQEQFSDNKQRIQRQKSQRSFLERQKMRQRQQFSKQSTASTFSRPEYFGANFSQQRHMPNTIRSQFQNMPVYGQPIMQSYPLSPQMLNYPLPDFHNYMMQMQMLQFMPQQPINFYQYPNFDNSLQNFEYRQFAQPSYPISNSNYNRGITDQLKKQQPKLPIPDKKIGKKIDKIDKPLDY